MCQSGGRERNGLRHLEHPQRLDYWLRLRIRARQELVGQAEYDFGRHTALASDGTTTISDRSDISQVKVGLNYRFTPATVVAKY